MTDTRLPGYWLTEMRFSDLTDKEWRVFTGLLMWSNEQGTDGRIPAKYVRYAHPEGVEDADIDALVGCDVLERTADGVQMLRWAEQRGLGLRQSTAEQVTNYRVNAAKRQAAFRERQKERSSVTRDVGGGLTSFPSSSSAYVPGNSTHDVTRYGNPRRYEPTASQMQTVQPGSDCGPGKHLRQPDGSCRICEARDIPEHEGFQHARVS